MTMKRLGLVLGCLLTLACAERIPLSKTGGAMLALPGDLPRAGDAATFTGSEPATLVFENLRTGAKRESPVQPGATVKLDAATLPDFTAEASVQGFRYEIVTPHGGSGREFTLVRDAGVARFPSVPVMTGPPEAPPATEGLVRATPPGTELIKDDPSQAGVQSYLAALGSSLQRPVDGVVFKPVERGTVTIPEWLRQPAREVPLVEATIAGDFPTYLVPEPYSASKAEAVYAPQAIRVVLTRSDPAILVTLTAVERK